jgi:NAD(P)-dependent dehydrogenase (short-subunit alcohol dehydrogenase family)
MNEKMRIAVIDGQGGGIGKVIVEKLRTSDLPGVTILALGTNSAATMQMKKAGAHEGATGENAIVYNMDQVDIVMGAIAILNANSMLGELTPKMAAAIGSSKAKKILIPVNRCGIQVVGLKPMNLSAYIDEAVEAVIDHLEERQQ